LANPVHQQGRNDMREYSNRTIAAVLAFGAAVTIAVTGPAIAGEATAAVLGPVSGTSVGALVPPAGAKQEALPVRPGFGYTIEFMTGIAAEALRPVPKQEVMIVRPGFGYTIDFMTGPNAEALFPPGWAKQRALTKSPQG
jgi:hypothetical protein